MRARLVVALLAGALVTLAAALAASASARKPALHARTLRVHVRAGVVVPQEGPLEGLALDGAKAAFVRGVPSTRNCGFGRRVYRWSLATGRTSLVSGAKTCGQPDTSTGSGIIAIALTRTGSAWLLNSGGNTESGEMLFSSAPKPHKDKVLATSDRFGGGTSSDFAGTWIGGLVSDGSRITYATWTTTADQTVTKSALWRLSGSKATKIADDSGAVVSASADRGRVALLRTDGSVAVYGSDGSLLNAIAAAGAPCIPESPGAPRCPGDAVALTSRLVAVLTESRPGRQAGSIRVYDRTTGALLHAWPAAGYSWQFDAYGGIAVYGAGARLHAIDLRTGKDVVVARRRRTIEEARLDRAGLLYYFNGRWSGKRGQNGTVAFVPFEKIAAKLGR